MVKGLQGHVAQVAKAEKLGANALSNIIKKGVKDLPNLIKALNSLNQSHLEFEILGWVVVLDKGD
ncbi:unnamed protein product [marine sediment metagenome]|uniref:Uncharacterized protein n=1 Tax=marine sediment metagenome TaxID=412755 RepID=X1D4K0_9ZZZZ